MVILRKIRSYVRREGRVTAAQEQAFNQDWQKFGIDFPVVPDWKKILIPDAPIALDIGFGNGESTLALAQAYPHWNIIGIEVYRAGIGHLFLQLKQNNIQNVHVFCGDAVEVLENAFAAESLQHVQIFFPDPWQKKRHHKRRLIQTDFIELITNRLKSQGELLLATDWQHYAEHMVQVLNAQTLLHNTSSEIFAVRDTIRPLTKFERRGQKAGHSVWDLKYKRN